MTTKIATGGVVAALMGFVAAAPLGAAEPAKPAPPPSSTVVQKFDDWSLQCRSDAAPKDASAKPQARQCEVVQTVQALNEAKQPAQVIAQLAFGRLAVGSPWLLTAALPPNVSLPSAVRIGNDGDTKFSLVLDWRKCLPGSCLANVQLDETSMTSLASRSGSNYVEWSSASGQSVRLALSFKGFEQALKALKATGS